MSFKWTYKRTLKTLVGMGGGGEKKEKKRNCHHTLAAKSKNIFSLSDQRFEKYKLLNLRLTEFDRCLKPSVVMILTKLVSLLPPVTQLRLNDS